MQNKVARNPLDASKNTSEIFDFCSRSLLILLFSLFCFFGKARQERYIWKSSKIENVNTSEDREHLHPPKKPKKGSPETRVWRKKTLTSGKAPKWTRSNNLMISLKITSGFCEKQPCESARKRTCPHASNATSRSAPNRKCQYFIRP